MIKTQTIDKVEKVSPGDNGNISWLHQGEQALACTILQQTTIYHCPLDGFTNKAAEIQSDFCGFVLS